MPSLSGNTVLAVNTGSFWPTTTEEAIRLLQGLDLADVELSLQPHEFYLTFWRGLCMPLCSDLLAMVEAGTLRVHSIHAPQISTEHGYSAKARGEYLAHTIRIGQLLGGKVIVVHPFHLFRTHEQALAYLRGAVPDVWPVLLPDTDALLEQARAANMTIALENIKVWADDDTGFFNAPANVRRFLDDVAHPSLCFTLDIFHAQLSGYLDGFVDTLADAVVNLHVADLTSTNQRVAPGEGIMAWEELIPSLKSFPNLHQVTIELTRAGPDEVARAVSFVTSVWT